MSDSQEFFYAHRYLTPTRYFTNKHRIWLILDSFFLPEQLTPLPKKPSLHRQLCPPYVLLHVAFGWHGLSRHSSTSEQLTPLPKKPSLQEQLCPPNVFVHVAFGWHESRKHSSMSEQFTPLPYKPLKQEQLYPPKVLVHLALG